MTSGFGLIRVTVSRLTPVHLEAVFKSWLISVLQCKADKSLKRRSQGCLQRPDISFY